MCQFCKLCSQYEQTVWLWATLKCITLYVAVRIAWFPCFIHHLLFLHNVLETGSVPVLNMLVGCYSGDSHRYLCLITGLLTASPNYLGASLPFHLRIGRDSIFKTLYFFHMIQKKHVETKNPESYNLCNPSFRTPPTCVSCSA
jgi:hypothetical protein